MATPRARIGGAVIGLTLLLAWPLAGPARADRTARLCREGCAEAKADCIAAARSVFTSAKSACPATRPERRPCVREGRAAFVVAKQACRATSRDVCRPCCADGGVNCVSTTTLPGQTTTTIVAATTTTVVSGASTTTIAGGPSTTTTVTPGATTTTVQLCGFHENGFVCGGACPAGQFCGARLADPGQCRCYADEEQCAPPGPGGCNLGACPGTNAFQTCDAHPESGACECFEPCGANPLQCSGVCSPTAGGAIPRLCGGTPGSCRCCIGPGGPCFSPGDCCSNGCVSGTCQ